LLLPAQVVVATTNPGKFADWRALLEPLGVLALRAEALAEVEESETELLENARRKAVSAALGSAQPAIADDIGLAIEALGGQPGALLKRWAMARGGWSAAQRFVGRYASSPAIYRCAVALAQPDGASVQVLGSVEGVIVRARGEGPGLEPCFLPIGASAVLGARRAEEAHFHHRARALALLRDAVS
jgi:XTP/dITP diphosphohydrolase